jgi:hypothetical protein
MSGSSYKVEGSRIQQQIDEGAVPNHVSNVCPKGTKMWVSYLLHEDSARKTMTD